MIVVPVTSPPIPALRLKLTVTPACLASANGLQILRELRVIGQGDSIATATAPVRGRQQFNYVLCQRDNINIFVLRLYDLWCQSWRRTKQAIQCEELTQPQA